MIDASADPKAVDPAILADALAHIARVAKGSEKQTRRTRWIIQRAEDALAGRMFEHNGINLPRHAGPNTAAALKFKVRTLKRLASDLTAGMQQLDRYADDLAAAAPADSLVAQAVTAIKTQADGLLPRAIEALNPNEGETEHAHD